MHKDAQDGINVFIDDEPTMKFNNFDYVEIKKAKPILDKKIDLEVFSGDTHKPVVTFVNQDNFGWCDLSDPDCEIDSEPPEKEKPDMPDVPKKIIKTIKRQQKQLVPYM